METVLVDLGLYCDEVYVLKTEFEFPSREITGYLCTIPYEGSYGEISGLSEVHE